MPLPVYVGAVDRWTPSPVNASGITTCCRPMAIGASPLGSPQGIMASSAGVGDKDLTRSQLCRLPGRRPYSGERVSAPTTRARNRPRNSLADLAMHYWASRYPPESGQPGAGHGRTVAQHVTLFGVSIRHRGNIVFPTGIGAIRAGTTGLAVPRGSRGPDSIDDLWHAALNSRGDYFNAKDPQELAASIIQVLNEPPRNRVRVRRWESRARSSRSPGISATGRATKRVGGGRQQVRARPEHRRAAHRQCRATRSTRRSGPAATQLDAQVAATGWDTNRRDRDDQRRDQHRGPVPVLTSSRLPSRPRSSPDGEVAATPAPRRSLFSTICAATRRTKASALTNFRARSHVLGDIVYSGAVPVGAPSQPVRRRRETPATATFVRRSRHERRCVYVGGNDGMLHAFDDSTTADAGKETWAYIPKAMFTGGDPNDTAHAPRTEFQIGALQLRFSARSALRAQVLRQRDAAHLGYRCHQHQYATSPPQSGNDWRTMLVGGARRGRPRDLCARRDDAGCADRTREADGRVVGARRSGSSPTPTSAMCSMRPRWSRPTATAGSRSSRPGYNNPGGKGILYVLESHGRDDPETAFARTSAPTRIRAAFHDPRVRAEPQRPVRAAGLRRRSLRQRLAIRSLQSRSTRTGRSSSSPRCTDAVGNDAADHDGRAHRDRPEQQRRPLYLQSAPASRSVENDASVR